MTTAEGAFILLDRASRPLEQMRRQAERTDRAFEKLGMTLDNVTHNKNVRGFDNLNRQMRTLERNEAGVTTHTDRMTRAFARNRHESDGLWLSIRKLGATLISLTKILSLLKLPAIAAGIGLLVQAVGALAGGIVALMPRIADLSGALAAIPALVTGVVGGMVTAKLAFKDFGQALGGNKKALESMTPAAKRLIDTLKLYGPVVAQLRTSAQQGGLFAGIDFAIRRLQRGLPMADRLIRMFSARLGGLAREGATRFTDQGFMRDFEAVASQGGRLLTQMGRALFNVVEALTSLAVAARPFTRWLGDTLLGFTEWGKAASQTARDTGRFQQFLDRTRVSLIQFGHITRDVWFTLRNIGRAARPLGDALWDSAERGTAAWRRYTASVTGQVTLARYFAGFKDTIYELVGLVGDLSQAIFRMGAQPGLSAMVARLRDAVPHLERFLNTITAALGPPLIEALGAVGRTLEHLVSATGPLTILLTVLSTALNLVNDLIDRFPALGKVMTGALVVVGINILIGRVGRLAGAWMTVAGAAGTAAAAQAAAAGVGAVGAARGAGGGGGSPIIFPTGVLDPRKAGRAGRLGRFGGAGLGAGLGRLGGAAARVGGKFVLPAALVLGAFDALTARREGNIGAQTAQTGSAVLSGASFGLIPRLRSHSEKMEASERLLLEGGTRRSYRPGAFLPIPGSYRDQRVLSLGGQLQERLRPFGGEKPSNRGDVVGQIKVYEQQIARVSRMQSQGAKDYRMQLEAQVAALKQVNAQLLLQQENNRRARNARRVRGQQNLAGRIASGLGTRFNARAGADGVESAMLDTAAMTVKSFKDLEGPGRRALATNVLAWAREAQKQNPKLADEYVTLQKQIESGFKTMGDNVIIQNGRIFQNSKRDWASIRRTLIQEATLAKIGVGNNFAAIRQMAVTQLTAMGFDAGTAATLVKNVASGVGGANAQVAAGPGARVSTAGGAPTYSPAVGGDGKGDGPGAPGGGGLISIGQRLQAMGYQVGENPAFGGVTPGVHKPNSYHYKGMAIDVNWPGGGAAEMAALDRIYPMLAALHPTELIWRSKGHFDHLHLAMGGSGSYMPGMQGAGGGMSSATMPGIKAPRMGVGGLGGMLGQQASNMYAAGLSTKVNESIAWGGWHGRGGSRRYRRPTMIGVGDRDETVTITPRGQGGGGRPISITVPIGRIDYRGAGDIENVVRSEVRAAIQSIADEIDGMGVEDDRGVLG